MLGILQLMGTRIQTLGIVGCLQHIYLLQDDLHLPQKSRIILTPVDWFFGQLVGHLQSCRPLHLGHHVFHRVRTELYGLMQTLVA